MKKTYAVIGLGRFGTAVAERLYALGNEVLVIDDDAERVQRMESRVTYAVVADARDEAVLRSLGMRNYDCAIVALPSRRQRSKSESMLREKFRTLDLRTAERSAMR